MAERPIFVPCRDARPPVKEIPIKFTWHSGFAPVQKKKSMMELHKAAESKHLVNILEVSTKSDESIGVSLSAFNRKIEVPQAGFISLEAAYQGSKVFRDGGPYTDIYQMQPKEAKRDERLKSSGELVGFKFGKQYWESEPKTAFYDWLYLQSVKDDKDALEQLFAFDGFSDIEFNPSKSINCQARSCAIVYSLFTRGLLQKAASDKLFFLEIMGDKPKAKKSTEDNQLALF